MLVPCGSRDDKHGVTDSEHRLRMAHLAVQDFFIKEFPVIVNDIEVKHGPMILTYRLINMLQTEANEELEALKREDPELHEFEREIYFVLGSDLIPSLDKWTEGRQFIDNTPCIVFNRKGVGSLSDEELLAHPNYPKHNPIHINVEESIIGIVSSSEVRKRIQQIPHN